MSNIIPPLISNSPPPPPSIDEEEDDEFGDFTGTNDFSFDCDSISLPSSPYPSPKKQLDIPFVNERLDINYNSKNNYKDNNEALVCETKKEEKTSSRNNEKDNVLKGGSVDAKVVNIEGNEDNCDENVAVHAEDEIKLPNLTSSNTAEDEDEQYSICTDNPENVSTVAIDYLGKNAVNMNCTVTEIEEKTEENSTPPSESGQNIKFELMSNESVTLKTENVLVNECTENGENVHQELDNILCYKLLENSMFVLSNAISDNSNENYKDDKLCQSQGYILNKLEEFSVTANEAEKLENMETVNKRDFVGARLIATDFFKNGENCSTLLEHSDMLNSKIRCVMEEVPSNTNNIPEAKINNEDIDDEFGDFAFPETDSPVKFCNVQKDSSTTEEFSNFAALEQSQDNPVLPKKIDNPVQSKDIDNAVTDDMPDDDFGDFAAHTVPDESCVDKFADFTADFSSEFAFSLDINEKEAYKKTVSILHDIFPSIDAPSDDFVISELGKDGIFAQLINITETNALKYQWAKSKSQEVLLKSLNIDARNVLFGPAWNTSMPKFASNLSSAPLEPVKSEILTPTPAQKSVPSTTVSDIPSAQFDWVSSGLTNPLDSVSGKQENNDQQIEPESKIKKKSDVSHTNKNIYGTVEFEEKPIELKNEALEKNIDYMVPEGQPVAPWHNIVLRETHISNEVKETNENSSIEIAGWLQPTIVTPELPRKDVSISFEDDVNDEEEFNDFQMVTQETCKTNPSQVVLESEYTVSGISSSTEANTNSSISNKSLVENNGLQHKVETLQKESFPIDNFTHTNIKSKNKLENAEMPQDEFDDFTDFHSSLPSTESPHPKSLTPVLEPLKPSVVQVEQPGSAYPKSLTPVLEPMKPSVVHIEHSPISTQISWPDPGITEDDINNIELSYSRVQVPPSSNVYAKEVKAKVVEKPSPTQKEQKTQSISKQSSAEEDEWTDFVSVQNVSPVHKLVQEKERSSTPDLPLSVLNLSNVHPAKTPIPVITPQGLVQTKLSTNQIISPVLNNKRYMMPPQLQSNPCQPSIISNQYASHMACGPVSGTGASSVNYPSLSSLNYQTQKCSVKPSDEDDWSDFVSHQSTSNIQHSKSVPNWQNQVHISHSSMYNTTPNIITNPVSFDVFRGNSDLMNDKKKAANSMVQSKKNSVPSISIPELDFIAPKNRTSQRK